MRRIVSILLCIMLLLTACSQAPPEAEQSEKVTNKPVVSPEIPKETTSQTVISAKPKVEIPDQAEWLDPVIVFSQEQADEYISRISTVEVTYEFFDLVDFSNALSMYYALPGYQHSEGAIISNGVLDRNAFLNQVKKSTDNYLAEYSGTEFSPLSADQFQTVFEIMCKGIDHLLECGLDENRLIEKLTNIKLAAWKGTGYGALTQQDTIFGINFSAVDAYNIDIEADPLHQVILHETMHLGQICSDDERNEKGFVANLGPCYSWDDSTIKPLFWNWYIEGSAESLSMSCNNLSTPMVYEPYVKALQTMSVATILSQSPGTIERISLCSDLHSLFTFFGADNEIKRQEILNMMYALEIAYAQPREFYQTYKQTYGKLIDNKLSHHSQLIASAGQTLTKIFYEDLAQYMTEGMTLKEIFSLMTVFEVEMSRLVRYTSVPKDAAEFIEEYSGIQTEFLNLLAEATGYSFDEIQGQYLAWYYGDTLDLSVLSPASQTWVNGVYTSRANNKRNTIIEIAQ